MSKQRTVTLNNGQVMPLMQFGTWRSERGKVGAAVREALRTGYRGLDCAAAYQNEDEVGDAVQEFIASGGARREDLWITSKLWNTCHRPESVRAACEQTLRDLKCGYLDLYLVHFPCAWQFGGTRITPENWRPADADGEIVFDHGVTLQQTWAAMESLVDDGLVKSIGVSNYTLLQLHDLLAYARITPVVNQIECHPYNTRAEHKREVERHMALHVEAYAPLGSGAASVLDDAVIAGIAKAHGATPAQVCLAWGMQRGTTVLPKSVTPARIEENFCALALELRDEEMEQITALNRDFLACDMREFWQYPANA